MLSRTPLLLLACGAARAQYPGSDAFAGSGCTCDSFCNSGCSPSSGILKPSAPQNVTLYRMTPLNVDDAADKNTGDAAGDTSYVMWRRTAAYDCAHPSSSGHSHGGSSWSCATLIVAGDDPDSTDLVIGFTVEIDGKWGPYLYCNPANSKHPEDDWICATSPTTNTGGTVPNYPAQCTATNFTGSNDYCYTNKASTTVSDTDLAGCCSAASEHKAYGYTYFASNKTCGIYTSFYNKASPCEGGVTGHLADGGHSSHACDCPKVHQSVGRKNMSSDGSHGGMSGGGMMIAGGLWYSTTQDGECKPGHTPGDGTCSWRTVGVAKAVNASCLYNRIDGAIEGRNPTCFADCPAANPGTPWKYNRTSSCYSGCYSTTTKSMTHEQMVEPWNLAFASDDASQGGCLSVAVPGH